MAYGLSPFERIWAPRQQLSEAMAKRWFETVVPLALLTLVLAFSVAVVPNFLTFGGMASTAREFAEFGFVALAMAIVLIGGGVDLSVGSVFALANFCALYLVSVAGFSAWTSLFLVPLAGAALGAINGFLIGFLRARALLTTMAMLIVFRSIYDLLIYNFATDLSAGAVESALWGLARRRLMVRCAGECHCPRRGRDRVSLGAEPQQARLAHRRGGRRTPRGRAMRVCGSTGSCSRRM